MMLLVVLHNVKLTCMIQASDNFPDKRSRFPVFSFFFSFFTSFLFFSTKAAANGFFLLFLLFTWAFFRSFVEIRTEGVGLNSFVS